jgi:hypothetical protein
VSARAWRVRREKRTRQDGVPAWLLRADGREADGLATGPGRTAEPAGRTQVRDCRLPAMQVVLAGVRRRLWVHRAGPARKALPVVRGDPVRASARVVEEAAGKDAVRQGCLRGMCCRGASQSSGGTK